MGGRAVGAVLLAGALQLSACATASRTAVSHSYFQDLGEVAFSSLSEAVERVLERAHGFRIVRSDEQYSTVFYQTAWREREPFPDEEESGVSEARSRVVVRGQRTTGGAFRVIFEGENEIRTDSIPTWHTASITADFREWMGEIEADLAEAASPGGDA